jgi:topoisomerase-4 subunit A
MLGKRAGISSGSMLVFPLDEVPELNRGKGNKLYNIPSKKFKSGDESMVAIAVVCEKQKLRIESGQRHTTLKYHDLDDYAGSRGQRGRKLPRGFQNVKAVRVE